MKTGAVPSRRRWTKDPAARLLAGRTTRLRSGVLLERSALLTFAQADALCAALRASDRFAQAETIRSHHATGTQARFFVRFARVLAQLADEKHFGDIRVERGVRQRQDMDFAPLTERPGWYRCIHFYPDDEDDPIYETHTHDGCTCMDWTHRVRRPEEQCKHQQALRAQLGMPSLAEERAEERRRLRELSRIAPMGATADERKAALSRAMALDF